MSTTETLIAIIVPIVVILVLITLVVFFVVRRRRLRERFGPEYDRAVQSGDGRLAAERELHSREKRHRDLDIRELPPGARERYAEDWNKAQQEFVDHPDRSVTDADRLVTQLMRDRGYPTEGFEQRLKDLSVEHANTLEQYRAAHDISRRNEQGEATTEELRGAMVHYRALFQELLGGTGGTGGTHRRGDSPHAA
ncbi:hypothetical protein ACIQMP_03740 [Streptomyces sp. NPDC091385]|uniref:hypothetical protein n=1 Tax=Streptomyces sp. NPDC091385 TaxID=3365997 RepID=UPI0037F10BDD